MKNKILHIVPLFLLPIWINAQPTTISQNENFAYAMKDILELYSPQEFKNEKVYRIWFDDFQVIELVTTENSLVNGTLVNYVTKVVRNGKKNKIISQKLKIPENTTKSLFEKFKNQNIETLPDSRDIDGYVFGCDGNSVTFEIKTTNVNRTYFYWEPENNNYQDSTNINIIAVRQILNAVNGEMNCSRLFRNFTASLGVGEYHYGMIILKVK
ncbi:hypothetical protein ACUNWD_14980 [Sunxiuqinia sp. A32]|uniref:hypothetical protein n=1 Tax=Sunxiuqinia sp. A32 TaxID=3461496 RepID=UPI004046050F